MRRSALVLSLWSLAALGCGGPGASERPTPLAHRAPLASTPAAGASDGGAAAGPVEVRLLAFNDFHGNLKPPTGKVPKVDGEVGGAPWFAAHVKKLAAEKPASIVVAAGDLVGASPLASALFHDEPTIDVMNAIGLSVTSLGNHEFDEGLAEILRLKNGGCHPKDGCRYTSTFGGAKYDILGANVRGASGNPLPAWVVREVRGIPIAFVGMPLEGTPHAVTPAGVAGLTFADEVKTANALVPEIRARGIETIVLLIHQGGETDGPSLDGCDNFRGPIVKIATQLDRAYDVIVSGHTHALYNCRIADRPVTSALSFGRVVTAIDLTIDPRTRDVVRSEAHNHPVTHDLPPDPEVAAIVARATTASGPLENRVIGRITENLPSGSRGAGEAALGNVIADAQLEATKKNGAKVALVNATGVRSDLVYARSGDEKEDGLVTYGEAFAVQPFGNELVTMTITGAALVATLEPSLRGGGPIQVSSGLEVHYSVAKKKITEIRLHGTPVDPKAPIRIATNSFLADRESGLANGTDRVVGPGDLEAFEAYFASHPKVSPPKLARILRE